MAALTHKRVYLLELSSTFRKNKQFRVGFGEYFLRYFLFSKCYYYTIRWETTNTMYKKHLSRTIHTGLFIASY